MKTALLLAVVSLSLGSLQAADTAYTALRVVGKRDGQDTLNHVIELRGRTGSPQPAVWKVVIDDPRARGGVRELEVERGKITGERTPTGHNVGGAMNFNQLNLDSEGAFTIANQEAQKGNILFSSVDYSLKSGTNGGAPVWDLELFDGKRGRVGTIEIAADSGAVLRHQFDSHRLADDDHAYLDDRGNPPPSSHSSQGYNGEGYSEPGQPFRNVPDFFHRLGRRFEKRSHQLENFFTGKGGEYHDDNNR